MTVRQKAWLITRIILKRLRFIAILAAVALMVGYWDTIRNYWDKWMRPPAAASRRLTPGHEFFCPMDPQVVRPGYEPNGDVPKCPICGMTLSMRETAEAVALPPGVTGRVQISPERIQLAGIRTVSVEVRSLHKRITTVGGVRFDESRLSRVVSRVSGYVEKLYVDKTFATVRQGDPLAEVYSPDLYSTAQTLLLDAKGAGRADLMASTRTRLELLGVSPEEIDAILASGKASPRLLIRSPRSGYVIEKAVQAGSNVEPGMMLLEVADLSAVWVEADVYEKDIAFLRPGQAAEAAVEAIPNRTFRGRLALVYPRLDAATRTNRVRFELDNPDGQLRPGMFATVTISTPLESIESRFLVVPERAVIDTGAKKVVYVERQPGLFEGVEVEIGPRVEVVDDGRTVDYYPVLKGLAAGDRVAAAGAFLIDAETRLNPAAASAYFGASGGPQVSTGN